MTRGGLHQAFDEADTAYAQMLQVLIAKLKSGG